MGDELFWVGLVPALVGLALVGRVLGAGWWAIVGFLVIYNGIRMWTSFWALRTGMASGMRVGAAIGSSWLPRAIELGGPGGGLCPRCRRAGRGRLVSERFGWAGVIGAAGVAVAGVALTRWFGPGLTSVRFALMAMVVLLLFRRIGL